MHDLLYLPRRPPPRLRHHQGHERRPHQAHGGVEEVRAVHMECRLDVRLQLGDQEGARPVEGAGQGGGQRATRRGEHLRIYGPRQRTHTLNINSIIELHVVLLSVRE